MPSDPAVRKIIHVDMDMFFAAVELKDRPDLKGRPVVVGGPPNSRSVVTTATYEARKFGIHSGMSCTEAHKRCPACLFIRPHFEKYRQVSDRIRAVFHEFTDAVETVSLDEAYLDVTVNTLGEPSATRIAKAIKRKIVEATGLTASAGVASTMFVAKIASDHRKPDGLTVVPPEGVLEFIRPLPVIKIPGIGKVTNAHLNEMGIHTVADLERRSLEFLQERFGTFGQYLYEIARGIDEREVTPYWERKSLGEEETFPQDILDMDLLLEYLKGCAQKVWEGLQEEDKRARTLTLKIKYFDFQTITRRATRDEFFLSPEQIFLAAGELLKLTEAGRKKVRLAGLSLSTFHPRPVRAPRQLCFPFKEEA